MQRKCLVWSCLCLGVLCAQSFAQLPNGSGAGAAAQPSGQAQTAPPTDDMFAQGSTGQATSGAPSFSPAMLGDFLGMFACRTITVQGFQTINSFQTQVISVGDRQVQIQVPVTRTVPIVGRDTICVPIATYGDFRIGEDESPRPQDRFALAYNYYNGVTGFSNNAAGTTNTVNGLAANGLPASVTTFIPGIPAPQLEVHRQEFLWEKTFFDQNASFELRVPVLETRGDGGFAGNDFGDMTAVAKLAVYNNTATRDLVSLGLAVTAPTGPSIATNEGSIHSTVIQPWVGYVWNAGDFYVEGFSAVAVPSDARDTTIMFNDIGIGYWLYRSRGDGLISAIIPTLETHVTTPLNHRDPNAPIVVPDLVDLTAGAHIGLGDRWFLTVGVATPVSGPRPFDVEAIAFVNWRF